MLVLMLHNLPIQVKNMHSLARIQPTKIDFGSKLHDNYLYNFYYLEFTTILA